MWWPAGAEAGVDGVPLLDRQHRRTAVERDGEAVEETAWPSWVRSRRDDVQALGQPILPRRHRRRCALVWVDATFDRAAANRLDGVLLAMQADTWNPGPASAQQAVVDRIRARTAAFGGRVLVLQGDSHTSTVDNPLVLPNFTRIVVHGETLPFEYLCLTIDPLSAIELRTSKWAPSRWASAANETVRGHTSRRPPR